MLPVNYAEFLERKTHVGCNMDQAGREASTGTLAL